RLGLPDTWDRACTWVFLLCRRGPRLAGLPDDRHMIIGRVLRNQPAGPLGNAGPAPTTIGCTDSTRSSETLSPSRGPGKLPKVSGFWKVEQAPFTVQLLTVRVLILVSSQAGTRFRQFRCQRSPGPTGRGPGNGLRAGCPLLQRARGEGRGVVSAGEQ